MLAVNRVGMRFGGVAALDDISFEVPSGQVCALIGPNGAGKTTLFNVITGLYRPQSGSVSFEGVDLLSASRSSLAARGIARTFQNVALFGGLTALENVLVGAYSNSRGGFFACALRLRAMRQSEREARKRCLGIMRRLEVDAIADRAISELPFGTLKRVELARALAVEPRLLLLDEPAAGLAHAEVDELIALLRSIQRDTGVSLVIVEHHMRLVMTLSERVVALNFGRVVADGTPDEVGRAPAVVEAYLGSAA